MSSASTPAPRAKSPGDTRSGPTRHTLFLPVLIFLIGAASLAFYQVLSLTDQEEQLRNASETMDARVTHANYEKAKFFRLVRDVLQLSDKDPNAEAVATQYKLHKIAEARPELLNAGTPADNDMSGFASGLTNAAPPGQRPATNGAPVGKPPAVPSQ